MSSQEAVLSRHFTARRSISHAVASDPDRLFNALLEVSLDTYENHSYHYDDFRVSAVAAVYDKYLHPKILAGGNNTPYKEADPRQCAETGMMLSFEEGDIFFGAVLLRSKPPEDKPVQGLRRMDFLIPCDPCQPVLELISPSIRIGTFENDEVEPKGAILLEDGITFTLGLGEHPVTPFAITPLEFIKNGLTQLYVPSNAGKLFVLANTPKTNCGDVVHL